MDKNMIKTHGERGQGPGRALTVATRCYSLVRSPTAAYTIYTGGVSGYSLFHLTPTTFVA